MVLNKARTVHSKLTLLVALTSAAAVLLICSSMLIANLIDQTRIAVDRVDTQATIIATHSSASLSFDQNDAATETLGALRADESFIAGAIFATDGKRFTDYATPNHKLSVPKTAEPVGHRWAGKNLILTRPITTPDNKPLGTVTLVYDMQPLYDGMWRQFLLAMVAGAIALITSLALAAKLRRALVNPIAELSKTAQAVSSTRDYSVRATKHGVDELGDLTDTFNHMLGEIERYNKDLARSNEELEHFAYIASHDLQEPLRKIQTFGDMLKADFAEHLGDNGADYIRRMNDAATRMRLLIDDLLTYSRIKSRAKPIAPINLHQVLDGVLRDLEVRITELNATLDIGDLPTIDADAMQMRQLLQNLIGNALKFHKKDQPPHIRVAARILDHENNLLPQQAVPQRICEITVKDNGIGFDEKYLDRIFAPFQRLHGRGVYEGSGVGLAVCRKIVNRHHGTITARSEEGAGAVFIVRLPVNQPKNDDRI